jgi:hypothetical protein
MFSTERNIEIEYECLHSHVRSHGDFMKLRIIAQGMACVFAVLSSANSSMAAGESAFSAMTALPAEERAHLARIEGPEENSQPDRWYFDVFAADSKSGLREYVVTEHEIVARRELSQFASDLTAEDVLGSRFLRTDSSEVEKLARDYASANNLVIAFLSVTLAKPLHDGRPVWTARCFNLAGVEFGRLVVAAENKTVFTHQGFSHEPSLLSPRIETAANKHKTEPADDHARHPQTQKLPIKRAEQRSQVAVHSNPVPPTPEENTVVSAQARRPWWNLFGH